MTTTQPQPTIAEQSAAVSAGAATRLPPEVVAAFSAEQAGLDAAGLPAGVTAPGAPMPDGALLDVHGSPTTLTVARADRPAVVVFYRGAWCPYCNVTLRTYQQGLLPELERRGVGLIAVSPQKADGSLSTQEANELTFTVLSDPGNSVAGQLGILTAPTDGTREAQGALGLDLATVNADGTYGLPMPTVAVVDRRGTLRWIDVHPNYTTRSEVADILAAVAGLDD
ncbi:peroxiredoxin-like family protein [Streptacidiphilus cavernicola]|uniref:thioredoxin-dependent peroxiredoxin n=1 Tax=Streptacidiphilus cavernicola TaxID=3342716 RepID=A0ABV6W285_9ACTN